MRVPDRSVKAAKPSAAKSPALRGPSFGLYVTEPARGALEYAAMPFTAPWLWFAARGDGHAVLVLPGLLATDTSTRPMRHVLRMLGYDVHGWSLGRNLGPTAEILDGMPRRLAELAERSGGPVSIVGWSLGGIFARELARDQPAEVRQVITLGSPFALVHPSQSRAGRVYRRREHLHAHPGRIRTGEQMSNPLLVPSTAIFSRRDGIVAWRACVAPPSARHENVEVRCSHLGFGVDAAALWVVADRLAQPADQWRRFQPPAHLRFAFPSLSTRD